eukprot:gene1255-15990_t
MCNHPQYGPRVKQMCAKSCGTCGRGGGGGGGGGGRYPPAVRVWCRAVAAGAYARLEGDAMNVLVHLGHGNGVVDFLQTVFLLAPQGGLVREELAEHVHGEGGVPPEATLLDLQFEEWSLTMRVGPDTPMGRVREFVATKMQCPISLLRTCIDLRLMQRRESWSASKGGVDYNKYTDLRDRGTPATLGVTGGEGGAYCCVEVLIRNASGGALRAFLRNHMREQQRLQEADVAGPAEAPLVQEAEDARSAVPERAEPAEPQPARRRPPCPPAPPGYVAGSEPERRVPEARRPPRPPARMPTGNALVVLPAVQQERGGRPPPRRPDDAGRRAGGAGKRARSPTPPPGYEAAAGREAASEDRPRTIVPEPLRIKADGQGMRLVDSESAKARGRVIVTLRREQAKCVQFSMCKTTNMESLFAQARKHLCEVPAWWPHDGGNRQLREADTPAALQWGDVMCVRPCMTTRGGWQCTNCLTFGAAKDTVCGRCACPRCAVCRNRWEASRADKAAKLQRQKAPLSADSVQQQRNEARSLLQRWRGWFDSGRCPGGPEAGRRELLDMLADEFGGRGALAATLATMPAGATSCAADGAAGPIGSAWWEPVLAVLCVLLICAVVAGGRMRGCRRRGGRPVLPAAVPAE